MGRGSEQACASWEEGGFGEGAAWVTGCVGLVLQAGEGGVCHRGTEEGEIGEEPGDVGEKIDGK